MHNQAVEEPASRTEILLRAIFHAICRSPVQELPEKSEEYFSWRVLQAGIFFARFGGRVDIRQKTILDLGCGFGSTCICLAQQGARRVVGIDTDHERVAFARNKLKSEFSALAHKIVFLTPAELNDERFDIVISQDCFEHYEDPTAVMRTIRSFLVDEGQVLIGFSPLWKSPYGGHIGYMTKVPWAHLLFPERIIMHERRLHRPHENAHSFSEMRGGLNKMTYARFLESIHDSGYTIEFLSTNVSESKLNPFVNVVRRLPFCFEYFTKNLYAIVRPNAVAGSGRSGARARQVSSARNPVPSNGSEIRSTLRS
jgi:SAM-dependent methyltransferase